MPETLDLMLKVSVLIFMTYTLLVMGLELKTDSALQGLRNTLS